MFFFLRYFISLFILGVILFLQGCTAIQSNSAEIYEQVIDIDLSATHNYSLHAIIGINIYPNDHDNEENTGLLPLHAHSSFRSKQNEGGNIQNKGFSERQFDSKLLDKATVKSSFKSQRSNRKSSLVTTITSTHNFNIFASNNSIQTIEATRVYAGQHCYVFVETSQLSDTDLSLVNEIGSYFDTVIYPISTTNFDQTPYDVDNNGKLVILYANIDSDGYFYPIDMYSSESFEESNETDMLYIHYSYIEDSGSTTVSKNARVIAHEFQHLLNRSYRIDQGNIGSYETWIEEGLAEGAAKYVIGASFSEEHFDTLASDSFIANGLGFITWSGMFQSYVLSHTFMEYARIQSDMGVEFYKQLMMNITVANDYRALFAIVEENAFEGSNSKFASFSDLLRDYRITNLVNNETGLYSYGNNEGNPYRALLNSPRNVSSGSTIHAGGAIYINFDSADDEGFLNFNPVGAGDNIRYYRINYSI